LRKSRDDGTTRHQCKLGWETSSSSWKDGGIPSGRGRGKGDPKEGGNQPVGGASGEKRTGIHLALVRGGKGGFLELYRGLFVRGEEKFARREQKGGEGKSGRWNCPSSIVKRKERAFMEKVLVRRVQIQSRRQKSVRCCGRTRMPVYVGAGRDWCRREVRLEGGKGQSRLRSALPCPEKLHGEEETSMTAQIREYNKRGKED